MTLLSDKTNLTKIMIGSKGSKAHPVYMSLGGNFFV